MKKNILFLSIILISIFLITNISACISYPRLETKNNCDLNLNSQYYYLLKENNTWNSYFNESMLVSELNNVKVKCSFSDSDVQTIKDFFKNGYSIKEQKDSEYNSFLETARIENEKKDCGNNYSAIAKIGKFTGYVIKLKEKDEKGNICPMTLANNIDCPSGVVANIIWNDILPISPNSSSKPVACTMNYNPVCCIINKIQSTESNSCECKEAKKGTVLYKGQCNDLPVCVLEGTRSEGWSYHGHFEYALCKNCEPVCKFMGTQNEGWYSVCNNSDYDVLIEYSRCSNRSIVGGDKDEHGCIGSAGYSWCESKQKCLRSWEENCSEPIIAPVGIEIAMLKLKKDLNLENYPEETKHVFNGTSQLKATKSVKLFRIFNVKASLFADVDTKTGEIIKIKKPWWYFLSSE
jgi:hypothetical protein